MEAVGEIWEWIVDPVSPFFRFALLVALLSSIPFGVVGTCVVARRISYLSAAVAHSALGGIGLALYLQYHWQWTWMTPTVGALVVAVASALVVGWIQKRGSAQEDAAIGAVWTVGMALGLILISRTPGYIDLQAFLFGDILLVGRADVWLLASFSLLLLMLVFSNYRTLEAVLFDPEQAQVRGIPVFAVYLLLLVLVAITVVLMVTVVGIVLVIALLTLPAATAMRFCPSLRATMITAAVLAGVWGVGGILVSYFFDWPSGATIVLLAGISFALSRLWLRVARG
jgi:zinc transport system permease protein